MSDRAALLAWLRGQQRAQRDADIRAGRKAPRTMRETEQYLEHRETFEQRHARETEEHRQRRADKQARAAKWRAQRSAQAASTREGNADEQPQQ